MTRSDQISGAVPRAAGRRLAAALLPALAAGTAAASPPPGPDPVERGLWIGSLHLCRDTVEVAGAGEDSIGMPVLLLTLKPELRNGLKRETEARVGRALPVRLDGRTVSEPVVNEPITAGDLSLSGASRREVEALRAAAERPC